MLDTNVWLDWIVFNDPSVQWVGRDVSRLHIELLATARTRSELLDVLQRPVIARARARRAFAPDEDGSSGIDWFDRHTRISREPPRSALVCTDPDDQVFIDLAVSARAEWLLTRDRALLKLARRSFSMYGVRIVPPEHYRGCAAPDPA